MEAYQYRIRKEKEQANMFLNALETIKPGGKMHMYPENIIVVNPDEKINVFK